MTEEELNNIFNNQCVCFCWYCRPKEITWFWSTKNNKTIHIFDMEFNHILNAIKFMENKRNYRTEEIYNKIFDSILKNKNIENEFQNHVQRYKNLKYTYNLILSGLQRFYSPTFEFHKENYNKLISENTAVKTCRGYIYKNWKKWFGLKSCLTCSACIEENERSLTMEEIEYQEWLFK